LVRAAVVVVVTRPVSVVERVVVVRAVGAAVALTIDVVVAGAGWSGAALFWTCVAANALMLASEESVAAVAIARSTTPERMSGERFTMGTKRTRRPRRHMKAR
jgi:hypothetical protein